MGMNIKEFVHRRNEAFIAFVLHDDRKAVEKYCRDYGVQMPDNPDVMAAGIYKAVQEVVDIPDDVKSKAAFKCMKLGFTPFITPFEPKEG